MTILMRCIRQRTRAIGYKCDSLRLLRSRYTKYSFMTAATITSGGASIEYPVNTSGGYSFLVEEDDVRGISKLRLDAFLSHKISSTALIQNEEEEVIQFTPSRARLQSTIKEGLVMVNGKLLTKASYPVKVGDTIQCSIISPPPLRANPENIPLNIVYEDEHVIVIDKTADMVMHPSPGHCSGTMVNALLHHCGISEGISLDDSDPSMGSSLDGSDKSIRPGIVHRLDKGTTGLVVVAKSDIAHASLSRQFKDRTVEREYISITLGIPRPGSGRIETNIGRDFRDRKKMAAFEYECTRGKVAASNYTVLKVLGASNCALVSWKLETGRTHQIRVHAKHIRHPLLGDDVYGGSETTVARVIGRGKSNLLSISHKVLQVLHNRPALHAQVLGFEHPTTHERLSFTADTPADFTSVLEILENISS